jgi:hypothetical protein
MGGVPIYVYDMHEDMSVPEMVRAGVALYLLVRLC